MVQASLIHLSVIHKFLTDGSPISWPNAASAFPLAAYLLLHRDEWISRSFLAFTLWANEPEVGVVRLPLCLPTE